MKTRALFTAFCLAAMLLAQGTVKAVSSGILMTENSPTSLTATLFSGANPIESFTVTNLANDKWSISLGGLATGIQATTWTEPDDNSSRFNNVTDNGTLNGITSLLVTSDALTAASGTHLSDGDLNFGFATINGSVGIYAGFTDNAKTAEPKSVPDGGSTVALLGIALLGVGFLHAKISRKPVTLAG
jgi:hypothetical protein